MALLDQLLELLGTNRTRMQWKVRAWKRSWERRKSSVANRAQTMTYAHQACPSCSHPAGADERTCTRCGEPLGGVAAQRVRRAFALVWGDDTPVVATLLVGANLVMYVATLLWTHQVGLSDRIVFAPHHLAVLRFGAEYTPAIDDGEWWRLLTTTFLHLDVLHLAMNLLSLWSVAIFLEEILGTTKTFALYIAVGIGASAVSYVWHTHTGIGIGNSAGASGAICGLIGIAIGYSTRHRNGARHLRNRYIGWAVWIAILAMSSWRIDNAAHVGGLVIGFALGLVVRRRADTGVLARRVWLAAAALALAVTVVSYVELARTPMADDDIRAAIDYTAPPFGGR